jgi:hypothetical protein
MSRLNNLTYGNSCVVSGSISVFILICLMIWLRNPLLNLIDIYRKDKVTCEIVVIDRKSHFDDSGSSLSGDGEGFGKKAISVDCGEDGSLDGVMGMESAEKKLKFDL